MKYSHAYDIAFELESNDPEGNDVTATMLRAALIKRANMDDDELMEATGAPFDTYECST
jgi:hypothetical protein